MKEAIFIIYLILIPITYIRARLAFKRNKEWNGSGLLYVIIIALINPIVIIGYMIYSIFKWDFWDKDLPKWL